MDRYAVIGNPVEHSRSPDIHTAFAEQTGQTLRYERILCEEKDFAATVDRFRSDGGKGLNVTLPFKLGALEYCDEVSERARLAGAVNTISFRDGRALGDNTDGAGLVRDLTDNLGVALAGKVIVLLGAGGAARGAIKPLLDCGPAELVLSNRNPWKPEVLAEEFRKYGPIRACTHRALKGDHVDVLINATSAGHAGETLPLPHDLLGEGAVCYDMSYGNAARPFLDWARAHGANSSADGIGMLVEQAAESFEIWRGLRPETAEIRKRLQSA